jgi:hypothetical protein
VTGSDTSLIQSLLRELLGLAEKVGEVRGETRVLRMDQRALHHRVRLLEKGRSPAKGSSAPTASPKRMARLRAFIKRMAERHDNMSFGAKFALWATPRGLLAWGAWQGWNQTVLGWLQRIVDLW